MQSEQKARWLGYVIGIICAVVFAGSVLVGIFTFGWAISVSIAIATVIAAPGLFVELKAMAEHFGDLMEYMYRSVQAYLKPKVEDEKTEAASIFSREHLADIVSLILASLGTGLLTFVAIHMFFMGFLSVAAPLSMTLAIFASVAMTISSLVFNANFLFKPHFEALKNGGQFLGINKLPPSNLPKREKIIIYTLGAVCGLMAAVGVAATIPTLPFSHLAMFAIAAVVVVPTIFMQVRVAMIAVRDWIKAKRLELQEGKAEVDLKEQLKNFLKKGGLTCRALIQSLFAGAAVYTMLVMLWNPNFFISLSLALFTALAEGLHTYTQYRPVFYPAANEGEDTEPLLQEVEDSVDAVTHDLQLQQAAALQRGTAISPQAAAVAASALMVEEESDDVSIEVEAHSPEPNAAQAAAAPPPQLRPEMHQSAAAAEPKRDDEVKEYELPLNLTHRQVSEFLDDMFVVLKDHGFEYDPTAKPKKIDPQQIKQHFDASLKILEDLKTGRCGAPTFHPEYHTFISHMIETRDRLSKQSQEETQSSTEELGPVEQGTPSDDENFKNKL